MKPTITRIFSLILFISITLTSCTKTVVSSKPLPPGQAKKITGSQSAKPYAPGQQKKTSSSPAPAKSSPGQSKKKN